MTHKNKILNNARHLRRKLMSAEKRLWQLLRCLQLAGYRFRRQVPLGQYIADFACHKAKVIIEPDESQHTEENAIFYDRKQIDWLNKQGYFVQRFWNDAVFQRPGVVIGEIFDVCRERGRLFQLHPFLLIFLTRF